MHIDKDRLERVATAAMQAIITAKEGRADAMPPADAAKRAVEFAMALLERVDAADSERQTRQAGAPRP